MSSSSTLGLSSTDWIALGSAVVAGCALAVSIWQGYVTRRHNHLSIRPHLDVVLEVSKADASHVSLRNGGLGPAIIKKLACRIDQDWIAIEKDEDYGSLIAFIRARTSECSFSHGLPDSASVLSPGDSLVLFQARPLENVDALFEAFNALISKLEVRVEYECLYGRPYKAATPQRPPL